jgi:hypothetical protein
MLQGDKVALRVAAYDDASYLPADLLRRRDDYVRNSRDFIIVSNLCLSIMARSGASRRAPAVHTGGCCVWWCGACLFACV